MRKNKFLMLYLLLIVSIAALTGCQNNAVDKDIDKENGKYSIVCTTFPQYDWIRQIVGEQADCFELTLLLDKGGDLHSFQPTAQNIAEISSADMFVYVGGESDKWVEDALKGAVNKDMKVVNLMEALGTAVKEEEVVEGMQEADEEHHHADEIEYDEHIWLSLKNATALTRVLSDNIQQLDTEYAAYYAENEKAYIEELEALDRVYADTVSSADMKTLLFGDRFPFRYMTDDYGLDYYAAFVGCSTETDASFETITFLSGKVDELGLNTILVIEGSDKKIAEIIKQNTQDKNQEILTMNSLQSVTAEDIKNGFTYVKAMQDNLEVLKKAIR